MAIGEKSGYLATSDAVDGEPREDVVGNTQLMSAGRFDQIQKTNALIRQFAATSWSQGGQDVEDRPGRIFTAIKVEPGAGQTVTYGLADDGTAWDINNSYIAGHCTRRLDTFGGQEQGAPPIDWVFALGDLDLADIPFEDDSGTEYNIGIACALIPARVEQNPRTGLYEFVEEIAVMGIAGEPDSVSYNSGLDELTFVLPDTTHIGGTVAPPHTLAGRSCVAWKINPLGVTSTAIVAGTVTFVAENRIVISGSFGQDPSGVSTTAADYRFCILGPTIWAAAATGGGPIGASGIAHLAYGRSTGGGSWDMDGQQRWPHMHLMLDTLIEMTAPSVSDPDFVSRPKINIRPNTNEPVGTPQITVYDEDGGNIVFQVTNSGISIAGGFSSIEDFIAGSGDDVYGDVDNSWQGDAWTRSFAIATGNNVETVDTDGQYIVTGEANGDVLLRNRGNLAQATIAPFSGAYVLTNGFTAVMNTVRTNGLQVAVCHDTYGEVFTRDTGVSLFDFNHGAACISVAMAYDRVFFAGVYSGTVSIRAFNMAGASQWTYDHGGTIFAVATDGSRVFAFGAAASGAGTSAAGSTLICLDAATGALIWEISPTAGSGEHSIVTDGDQVITSDGTDVLRVYAAHNGQFFYSLAGAGAANLALDRDFIVWGQNNIGSRYYIDRKKAFDTGDNNYIELGVGLTQDVATDGELVFVAQDEDAGDSNNSLVSYYRYNRARRWKKIHTIFPPGRFAFAKLAVPSD